MGKKLTEGAIARISDPGVYGDRDGLRLYVRASGSKDWQWRGTLHGQRLNLGLGSYPHVTLEEARQTALEYRKAARSGQDPRRVTKPDAVPTFAELAEEVIAMRQEDWRNGAKSADQWRASLRDYANPKIGNMPVDQISRRDVKAVLDPIWRKKHETARRVKQRIQLVMWEAVGREYRTDNPVIGMEKTMQKAKKAVRQHHKSLPWQEVGTALESIRNSNAWPATKLALEFLILTAARSGEVRMASWDEVDLDAHIWTLPPTRMKVEEEHVVPLSQPALAVLDAARELGDGSGLIFPAMRGGVLSDNTLSKLLRENRVGCVPHGFRSSFRNWCGETGVPRELAEKALAHTLPQVEGAYHTSSLLERRRPMMTAWADAVFSPETDNKVLRPKFG